MLGLTIFSTIFGGALSLIKKIFGFAISNPKAFIIGLSIVILLGAGWYSYHKITKLEAENATLIASNKTLKANNETLQANLNAAIEANKNNQIVIDQLSQAKTDAENRIQEMQKQVDASNQTIANIENMIANSTPAQDGPVAPVLANTINAIQQAEGN